MQEKESTLWHELLKGHDAMMMMIADCLPAKLRKYVKYVK